ncbi:hypothetical protein DD238_007086 [Peronospora effusa]|uniref:Uncharacterized protein n=1 Tax=Peronospora effusa TaxID=542832 RepID=A0A3M6VFE1_9STRA|nr:hypothetical protein DD238_007086 [Peronospora effusa]RQM11829.1 hypothetical protein DD237_007466 [Peronospora effusa]
MQVPAPLTEVANFTTTSGSNVPGKLEAYGYEQSLSISNLTLDRKMQKMQLTDFQSAAVIKSQEFRGNQTVSEAQTEL